ncbi:hypothetical protein PR003_g12211 [Phytophthora rubi]|uniref:Uncharacterized protein n=1 Tax=Phytophthora rubi TaxID=129364 RepID=A0A6A3LXN0_9STRA|nr:hypothetical protein PR002_g11584 [Phytophthora rubi]KAE9029652.1 hypothetical protein PR001_g11463 [Phytophthora rubi]KAE9337005.1 hypothetical protein PR003_g12211 [Phytophthora rubi]
MEMRETLSLGEVVYSDDDHLLEDLAVCVAGATASLALREDFYARARLVWSEHVTILRLERRFGRYYRMNEAAFEQLVEMLRPRLVVDGRMSTVRTGEAPISPEVVLHCTLRWLAGGSYLDVCGSGHLSVPSFSDAFTKACLLS